MFSSRYIKSINSVGQRFIVQYNLQYVLRGKTFRYKMENVSCIKYPLEDDTEATDIRYVSLISFTGQETKYKDNTSYPLEDEPEATEKDIK